MLEFVEKQNVRKFNLIVPAWLLIKQQSKISNSVQQSLYAVKTLSHLKQKQQLGCIPMCNQYWPNAVISILLITILNLPWNDLNLFLWLSRVDQLINLHNSSWISEVEASVPFREDNKLSMRPRMSDTYCSSWSSEGSFCSLTLPLHSSAPDEYRYNSRP